MTQNTIPAEAIAQACRTDYDNRYHKIKADLGIVAYERIWNNAVEFALTESMRQEQIMMLVNDIKLVARNGVTDVAEIRNLLLRKYPEVPGKIDAAIDAWLRQQAAIPAAAPAPSNAQAMRKLIEDAQGILAAHLPPNGPSKADTINALLELLDGPRSREALAAPSEMFDAVEDATEDDAEFIFLLAVASRLRVPSLIKRLSSLNYDAVCSELVVPT